MEIETGFRAYGWGNMPLQAVKLPIYVTIIWWERTQFSNSTFWRLVFSHSWFRIHLQLDFVSLEMNSEPLVWEHQSPKCFGGEPTILTRNLSPEVLASDCLSLPARSTRLILLVVVWLWIFPSSESDWKTLTNFIIPYISRDIYPWTWYHTDNSSYTCVTHLGKKVYQKKVDFSIYERTAWLSSGER